MAFDEKLADRVRKLMGSQDGLTERKMFGGLAFLINGNMSVGIHGDELIVRVEPETTTAALREIGARLFDITGRPMNGWILVGATGIDRPSSLAKWVRRGAAYASSLPVK
jgi:TfoX/Sxy family transcriptional regulator of competence genes